MTWRRVADLLLRRPPAPDDERSTKAKRLEGLAAETVQTTAAAHEMDRQSRLGSYSRVQLGPRK